MNCFFELLQVSLGTREKLSRVPSNVQWGKLKEESMRQTVMGVMLDGIERLPKEQRPSFNCLLDWIGGVQVIEATYQHHCERARLLTSLFRAGGYSSCVLKGIGTAQLYPEPARRQCGDIDLWVSGRRKDVVAWLRTQCENDHQKWHHVEAKLFEDVKVEVHFHPVWLYNPFYNRRLQRWFRELKDVQMEDSSNESYESREMGFNYPTAEFNVVYSLVHTFHHLMDEGVGLRHIVDYFYILKCFLAENTGYIQNMEIISALQRFGLSTFLGAMMYVLKEACGMAQEDLLFKPDCNAGRFLLDEIMLAGNFGHYDARIVRPKDESFLHRNIRKFKRQLRFLRYYPGEVLCAPLWKTWHWCWRQVNR